MAWLSSNSFVAGNAMSHAYLNNLANDIRAWGGDVNGGGYNLSNLAALTAATSVTNPLLIGGTAVSSTLTLQSTSGAGTSDAIVFKTASQSEKMRIDTLGRVLIGAASPSNANSKFSVTTAATTPTQLEILQVGNALALLGNKASDTNFYITNDYDSTGLGVANRSITLTKTGEVGIGTTSPAQMLQVGSTTNRGQVQVISNDSQGLIVQTGGGSGGSGAAISFYDGDTSYAAKISTSKSTTNSASLVFSTANGSAAFGERMRIDPSGNVGIGTASPSARLSLGTTTGDKFLLYDGGSGSSYGMALNASGIIRIFSVNSGTDTQIGIGGGDATFSPLFIVKGSGNVGIGTTSPAYKLELSTDSAGKPGVGGLWTVVSDERIKTDITPADLDRCYEIVKSVPLKHFGFAPGVYTDDQIQDKHSLGWIAQDVQKVFSKAVSVKPFTLKTEIPDGTEEYTEQDFTLETVEKTETSIEIIDGKPVRVSKVVASENKVLLFDTADVTDEDGDVVTEEYEVTPAILAVEATDLTEAIEAIPAVMGTRSVTHQMPRMITKTRPKVRHKVIEDCLDLNGGQMIAALYGAVQSLMEKVEMLTAKLEAAK